MKTPRLGGILGVFLALLALIGAASSATAQSHDVVDFFWVGDPLSNEYDSDPNLTLTLSASEAGAVGGSTTGETLGFNPGGWLFVGDNTSGVGDVETITYTFTFTSPVTDFTFDLVGISNNTGWTESFSNFNHTPTVTDISNSLWDGTTLSSNEFGSANLLFAGSVSSVSFDWVGSGSNSGSLVPNGTMSWVSAPPVPEPGALAMMIAAALVGALPRHRR